jgi:hypothetical protein
MANSDDEAKHLAPKLRMDVETLQGMPQGTFGTFVRDLTSQGLQLRVPKVDLGALPKMTEQELTAVREQMRSAFSADPVEHTREPEGTASTLPVAAASLQEEATATPRKEQPTGHKPASSNDAGEPSDRW